MGKEESIKSKGGRPSKYRLEFCDTLVAHMEQGGSFETFAAVCRVSIDTLYEWLKVHSEFSEAKKLGTALCLKFFEDVGKMGMTGQMRRVMEEIPITSTDPKSGVVTAVLDDKGRAMYHRKYAPQAFNATSWIFSLKNRFPQYFRDVQNFAVSGDGKGGAIGLKAVGMTPEEKLKEITEVQDALKELDAARALVRRKDQ